MLILAIPFVKNSRAQVPDIRRAPKGALATHDNYNRRNDKRQHPNPHDQLECWRRMNAAVPGYMGMRVSKRTEARIHYDAENPDQKK